MVNTDVEDIFKLIKDNEDISITFVSKQPLHLKENLKNILIETSFNELEKASQDKIFRKSVSFQEKQIDFEKAFDGIDYVLKELKDGLLLECVKGELVLGQESVNNSSEFLERVLTYEESYFNDISKFILLEQFGFVLYNCEDFREDVVGVRNVILCPNYDGSSDVENLRGLFDSVHEFCYSGSNKFTWLKSHGGKFKSKDMVLEKVSKCCENIDDFPERFVIISDTPGSGKTTVLLHWVKLYREKYPEKLVLHINLNQCQNLLKNLKRTGITLETVTEFLVSRFKVDNCRFYKDFLNACLGCKNKTAVLLDGLDEISPTFNKTVDNLIDFLLNKTLVWKIILTSRKNMKLEEYYPTYSLVPMDKTCQKTLMTLYMTPYTNGRDVSQFQNEILQLFDKNTQNTSVLPLGIPLHLKIICETFKKELDVFINTNVITLPKKLNILQLYENFFESKTNIFFTEKLEENTAQVDGVKDAMKEIFLRDCTLASMMILFEKPEKISDDFSVEKQMKLRKEHEKDKCGIITRFDHNNHRPEMLHRQLAEFFTAKWLSQNYKKTPNILNIITKTEYRTVRFFFDLMLAEESPNITNIIIGEQVTTTDTKTDKAGRNILHLAVVYTNDETIKNLCLKHPELVTMKDKVYEYEPIQYIQEPYQTSDLNKIEILLQNGADSTLTHFQTLLGSNFNEILRLTIKKDYLHTFKCFKTILKSKIYRKILKVTHGDEKHKFNIIQTVASYESLNILQYLLTDEEWRHRGIEKAMKITIERKNIQCINLINSKYKYTELKLEEKTALDIASETDDEIIIKRMIQLLKEDGITENTALNLSELLFEYLEKGKDELCRYLLESGATIQYNKGYETIPTKALKHNRTEILQYIFRVTKIQQSYEILLPTIIVAVQKEWITKETITPELVNKTDNKNMTILHHTASCSDVSEMLKYILKIQGNVDAEDINKATPLHHAVMYNRLTNVKILIENSANVNKQTIEEITPLMYARDFQILQILIKGGAEISLRDKRGYSSLHYATEYNCVDSINYLIQNGADVNVTDDNGMSSLMLCARSGKYSTMSCLINNNADLEQKDKYGYTALFYSIPSNNFETVKCLVQNGADINAADLHMATAILLACGNMETIFSYLVEKGADITRRDVDGRTALHYAISARNFNIIRILIEKRCDVNAEDSFRYKPLYYAILLNMSNSDTVTLLKKNGARV